MNGHEKGSGAGATRRDFIKTTTAIAWGMTAPWVIGTRKAAAQVAPVIADPRFTALVIDPAAIPQFVDVLPVPDLANSPGGWPVLSGLPLTISLKPVDCDILPQNVPAVFPTLQTPCWGYRNGDSYAHTYLGPTIVGKGTSDWTDPPVGTQVTFDYSGVSSGEHLLKTGDAAMAGATTIVDKHVHGTEMGEPEVRFIAHKHGSRGVDPASDGYAESWITPAGFQNQPDVSGVVPPSPGPGAHRHLYPNDQGACLA